MIQKLMLILLVASTYQMTHASVENSQVSFATLEEAEVAFNALNEDVIDLVERMEILEEAEEVLSAEDEDGESFTGRKRRRRRRRPVYNAGTASRPGGSRTRAGALSYCKMRGGSNCHKIRSNR